MARHLRVVVALFVLLAVPRVALAQGSILVDFFAAPGTGFADNTPAVPVGGNPGLTVGQQRIYVFLQAAAIWTQALKPANDIYVAAQFTSLGPNVLGSAGARFIWSNFPGAELPNTWYFDALADRLANADLSPPTYDIQASFSSDFAFYLGFDNNESPGTSDLLAVVLHEMGHGLNFANAVNERDGSIPAPSGSTEAFGDIYSQYTQDVTTGKTWNAMTPAERATSALNVRHVSWSGLHVKQDQYKVLERGEPAVRLTAQGATVTAMLGRASFGAAITASGTAGNVVAAIDAADVIGPSPTDGCSPITNDVRGAVALIDRGTCGFVVKVKHAQDAGAIAVLIGDNVTALPPPDLGGGDPTITIPSGRIGLADATAIRANLALGAAVRARLLLDTTVYAGTDRVRRQVMVAALNPVSPGSSISHFEAVASRNLLMEPAINSDLTSSLQPPNDLTLPLLTDLGWFTDRDGVQDGVDACLGSNTAPTVVLNSCDSFVPNKTYPSGCTTSDVLAACSVVPSRLYPSCIALATSVLRFAGEISGQQQGAIVRCAR
jgi:hypothetical protein